MKYVTANELKESLTSILQSHNLNEALINQLLSDDFINGAFELIQNVPENDEFMNFVRNFSEEQSLKSLTDARDKIATELCKEGYFTSICQYVIDTWRDIDFSLNVQLLTFDNNRNDVKSDSPKPGVILDTILNIAGFVPPLKPVVKETRIYEKIVTAVAEQDKKFYDIADRFSQDLWAVTMGVRGAFSTAKKQASPLVIDLDGDGTVETNKENSTVHFDHDNNGFAESTGWVGKDDGLLVRDINGNGQIDNGTELFGNNSVLSSGEKAANGFEALADLDSNNDGVFNSSDTAWDDVKVWKDSNGNGIVDEGELLTLTQAGVSGINLDYQDSTTTDENGNQHNQTGTFIKADGTTGSIHDVWFDADYADTVNKVEITIPDNIKDMPNISGFGNVCSLQEAMAQDESGELKALIEQYMTETNAAVRKGMIDKIIFHWTGVQDIDPLSRKPSYFADDNNPLEDARYLEALERFLGEKYSNRYWFGREDQNPHEQAAKYLLQGYDILAAYVSNELEAQTHCKTLLENIKLTWNEETQVWDIDISGAVNILNSLAETNLDSAIATLHFLEDIIEQQNMMVDAINTAFQNQATETNNLQEYYLNFGKLENKISNGSDIIYGTDDDNYINGLAGNDKIYGENGNDTLIGGTGNDYLVGGNGSDTYFFEGSWGKDSIDNSSTDEKGTNPDKILFGEGISPSDVTILRRANDLILSLHNGADTVTVYGYFLEAGTTTNTVDTIEFADGTVWDYEHVRVAWNAAPVSVGGFVTISGTNGNDKISGTSGNDFLSGEKGDDTINANAGNDVIYGGAGNDKLNGGAGDDTYIWNLGDGLDTIYDAGNNDTISFGDGISFSDLAFQCVNNSDLKIFIKNNPNQGIIIQDFLTSNLNYKIEELTFIDGSQVHLSEIALTLKQLSTGETITGTDFGDTIYANGGNDTVNAGNGNDTIYGGAGFDTIKGENGNDILIGGTGNDRLEGGAGDDTYIYNIGDGLDTIYDYQGSSTEGKNDKIKFGEGITPSDTIFSRKGDNLVITLFNDISQGIIIQDFFSNEHYQVEKLEFIDGTITDLITGLTLQQSDGHDKVSGTSYDDIIYGNRGNDTINGESGNDILIGGKGNDNLSGGNGNDTYIWNFGDGFDRVTDTAGNNIIQFGEGITLENLTFERSNENDSTNGNDLYIFVNGDRNQGINLYNFFGSTAYQNFSLKFADGSTFIPKDSGFDFTLPEGQIKLNDFNHNDILAGNDQDNTINGSSGNDILIGDKGNDNLSGGNGNDTYIWHLGNGFDRITDSSGNNIIQFGEGITLENLTFERSNKDDSTNGDDLYIFVNGDRNQGMNLYNFFGSTVYQNFSLQFADGSTFIPKDSGFDFALPEGQIVLDGYSHADTLTGNSQDNTINGSSGNDILIGGRGNDILKGGNDNDTYVWNFGDGFDYISDSSGNNIIEFGEGIALENLTFERSNKNDSTNGNDLYIFVNGDRNQGVQICNFFGSPSYRNFTLKFSDGSTFVPKDNGFTLALPEGQTVLDGYSYADILTGNSQDNTINGNNGDDVLIGGKGNDTLKGGNGNDIYIWNQDDGFDYLSDASGTNVIQFGEGISLENLTFERSSENDSTNGDDLYIFVNGDRNQGMQICNFFGSPSYRNFTLKFADGTTQALSTDLPLSQLPEVNLTLNGTADDDILTGGIGNDIINTGDGYNDITGGQGNDTITGGYDRDTYYYNLGDGFDTIIDPNGKDQIIFGEGISKDDLRFRRNGNDLWLIINNDLAQGMKLVNFFASDDNKIETLKFADNSSVNLATAGLTLDQWDTDDNITGTSYDDVIYGNNGKDTLSGGSGKDILIGGHGNDTLYGGAGNDTYRWNSGDGFDTIEDNSGQNSVEFGDGIDFDDLTFTKIGENLYITINNNPTEGLNLSKFFNNDSYKNFTLKFKDGTQHILNENGLTFSQGDTFDTINGTNFNDVIYANDGNDTVNALAGNDTVYGGKGNDIIDAGNGNDTLVGGEGNDTLAGGVGDDTYIYNLGDGFDTISDTDGTDKIVLGTGITADMLSFSREGNDLRIIINNDKLQGFLLKNQFAAGTSKIESIEFADESTLSLINKGFTLNQNNIDETISGTDFNDTINAAAGNDTVNAGEGDDTITGGLGNDNLNGGNGDDTYIYNMGDGFDTITETSGADKIVLGTGIALENLRFIREGNNLRILINNNVDQGFLLVNQFAGADTRIEQLQFADNSVLDLVNDSLTFEQYNGGETINGTDNDDTIYGRGGNDTIDAGDGDDTIVGGIGDDTLSGGYGRDTYIYNLGDGADTINETRGNDIIKFGAGITQDDLTFTQEGNNLKILIDNDPYQSILINNFYSNVNNQVEKLQFADGSTFNLSTQGLTLTQNNGDETINGTGYNDVIYGNGGHDTINAGEGNDTIVGGIGNDILNGGNGDDTYIYNLGDGFDTITESGGNDKIVFGEGISQSDLSFEKIGNDLKISINGNEVKGIQINDHFRYDSSKVETIEFHDGSTLDISNADQLIQAMNSFSVSNSASTDTLSNPTEDVSDMYSLAASQDLTRKAI